MPSVSEREHAIAKLKAEHQALETRLERLLARPYLSAEADLEKKQIQKKKLRIKDQLLALHALRLAS